MSSSRLALSFRMFQNGQLIREITLTQAVIKIGKVPSAHLQIADDAVSRMHAIVEVTGREVSVIDLGSTRGTFVNGKRVNKARLESGDVLTLGDTRIELAIGDTARPPALPLAARRTTGLPATVSGVIEAAPAASAIASAAPGVIVAAPGVTAAAPGVTVATPGVTAVALPVDPVRIPAVSLHAVTDAAHEHGAARAVEVAAMLGDSVVGVKHCIDPRGGRISPVTWGLVGGAALCLAASAIAFLASVRSAADNHARFDTWTRVERKPAYGFRPHRLGLAVDWVAFGGSGLALLGFSVGLLRMRRERVSPYYRIGTAPGVELAFDGAPGPAFPLVAPSGDDFVFNFAPGIDGELLLDGSSTPLGELAAAGRARPSASTPGALELAIPRNARIRARAGRVTVMVSEVARPRRHAVPLLAGLERRTLAYVAGSLVLHLAIWGVLQLVPPDGTSISVELPVSEPIAVALQGTVPNDPVPPPSEQPGETGGEPGSPAMALPSGAAGHPDAAAQARGQIAQTDAPTQLARTSAVDDARRAGLLGNEQLIASIDTIAELPDVASGFDTRSFSGPVYGAYGGEGRGNFGGGVVGFGAGGGCADAVCGLIPGSSRYLTIGDGPGAGGRYGLPGRGVGDRAHAPSVPRVGTPEVSGGAGYDKAIIRRYIRRNIDKIGYCYDKQLLAHPDLGGTLTVSFFIAPTGGVQTATGTGFDREVARCVADVIRTIAFPTPGDGIGVQVNYPFQFHAPGR